MKYKVRTNYLTPNKWSRSQKNLRPEWIVLHWEAVVNGKADAIRNYFENRKYGKDGYGSANEVIDTNGDVLIMIPKDEMAYHVGSKKYTIYKERMMGDIYPNSICYGIETPTIDMQGTIDSKIYDVIIDRITDLLIEFKLPYNKVATHGMITGKDCHKYFNPSWGEINWERWDLFMDDIHESYVGKINNREENDMSQLYTYCGRTLYKGKTGGDVKVWQIAMKKAGYYTMGIDGSIGNGGHSAIIKFQTERNLVVDGFFGKGSASELNIVLNEIENNQNPQEPINNELPTGVYSNYSKGENIKIIQSWLKSLGYEIDEDGSFGNGTEAVLRFFQEDNKLPVTGIYDIKTRGKMLEKPRCKYQEFKYDKQTTVVKMRIKDFHTVLIDVPKRKSLYNIMKGLSWKPKLLANGGLFNMTSEGEDLNIMIDTYKKAGSVYFSKKGMKMSHYDELSFGEPDSTTKSFLGGSPYILENGEFTTEYYETLGKSYTDGKHPRNGIGIDDEYIYLVLVKGRASWLGYYGVTLQQLATIFKNLGCKHAQNNDGGGSTGAIDNSFRWIFKSWRTIGNAIAFYRK